MSTTDDFGNVVEAIHDLDLEYVYPPKGERICAQDERFASVNEAIGTLQYNLEQHIAQCADGLAPLADFIASSWAVLDEYEARLAKLEDAARPIMDETGVLVSHDAWDAMERELEALRAFKASVPWKALVTTWLESEQGTPEWNDLHEFVSKHGPSGPVEYMQNGNAA